MIDCFNTTNNSILLHFRYKVLKSERQTKGLEMKLHTQKRIKAKNKRIRVGVMANKVRVGKPVGFRIATLIHPCWGKSVGLQFYLHDHIFVFTLEASINHMQYNMATISLSTVALVVVSFKLISPFW